MTRQRVHIFAGISYSGRRIRAWCTCGYGTTPRVDRERAARALEAAHALQDPVCALCGRDRARPDLQGYARNQEVRRHLQVLDVGGGEQLLVCADDDKACRDLSAQRQVHLDRAAFEAFGLEPPRPTLRVVQERRDAGEKQ